MTILALDISTQTGYCLMINGIPVEYGTFSVPNKPYEYEEEYPNNVMNFVHDYSDSLMDLIDGILGKFKPIDLIIIEETTSSRNNQSQRVIEWLHYLIYANLRLQKSPVKYVRTGEWRSVIDLVLSKDDKKKNKLVKDGKAKGRINRKHLAVRYASQLLNKKLKQKDNNTADAICIAAAAFKGCDFVTYYRRTAEDTSTTETSG